MYIKNNLGSYGGLGSVWGDTDSKKDKETKPTDKITPKVAIKKDTTHKSQIKDKSKHLRPHPKRPEHKILPKRKVKVETKKVEPKKIEIKKPGKAPQHPHHVEARQVMKPKAVVKAPSSIQISRPRVPAIPPMVPKKVEPTYYIRPTPPKVSNEGAAKEILTVAKEGIITAVANKQIQAVPPGKTYWTSSGPVFSKEPVAGGIPMEYVQPLLYKKEPVVTNLRDLPKLDLPPVSGISGFGDYVSTGLGEFTIGSAIEFGIILAVLGLLIVGGYYYNKKP